MAERTVSVRVNLKADGLTNIGLTTAQIAKNMGAAFTAANKLKDVTASKSMIAGMNAAALGARDPFSAFRFTAAASASPVADMMKKLGSASATKQVAASMIEGMTAAATASGTNPVARRAAMEAKLEAIRNRPESIFSTATTQIGRFNAALGVGTASLVGFAAAASPAVMETLTKSMKLLAGEVGIILTPLIVSVSGAFQTFARLVKGFNDLTGNKIGQFFKMGNGPWESLKLLGEKLGLIKKDTAVSFNFQAQSSNIEDMHDIIQREALKDPMQQAEAEQQARAIQELARQIGYLGDQLGIPHNTAWQVNQ